MELNEAIKQLQKSFEAFGVELMKAMTPIMKAINKVVCLNNADSKLYYLAMHSKKARVRKKNLRRIWLQRLATTNNNQ